MPLDELDIARGERHHIELALRHAVREVGDVELEFTATDTSGNPFAARLIIRVARPVGASIRLWGLMTDCSHEHREITRPVVGKPVPLIAGPLIRRATRSVVFGLAAIFASYGLAVSAHRPMPAAPPAAAAIQRADLLGQALTDHADEEKVLESAVVSMEASVGELVGLGRELAAEWTELDELRTKIAELIGRTPPELAGRLRALLAQIDRAAARPVAPPGAVSEPSSPPARDVEPEPEPEAASPSTAPPASEPAAPGEVPRAPGEAAL